MRLKAFKIFIFITCYHTHFICASVEINMFNLKIERLDSYDLAINTFKNLLCTNKIDLYNLKIADNLPIHCHNQMRDLLFRFDDISGWCLSRSIRNTRESVELDNNVHTIFIFCYEKMENILRMNEIETEIFCYTDVDIFIHNGNVISIRSKENYDGCLKQSFQGTESYSPILRNIRRVFEKIYEYQLANISGRSNYSQNPNHVVSKIDVNSDKVEVIRNDMVISTNCGSGYKNENIITESVYEIISDNDNKKNGGINRSSTSSKRRKSGAEILDYTHSKFKIGHNFQKHQSSLEKVHGFSKPGKIVDRKKCEPRLDSKNGDYDIMKIEEKSENYILSEDKTEKYNLSEEKTSRDTQIIKKMHSERAITNYNIFKKEESKIQGVYSFHPHLKYNAIVKENTVKKNIPKLDILKIKQSAGSSSKADESKIYWNIDRREDSKSSLNTVTIDIPTGFSLKHKNNMPQAHNLLDKNIMSQARNSLDKNKYPNQNLPIIRNHSYCLIGLPKINSNGMIIKQNNSLFSTQDNIPSCSHSKRTTDLEKSTQAFKRNPEIQIKESQKISANAIQKISVNVSQKIFGNDQSGILDVKAKILASLYTLNSLNGYIKRTKYILEDNKKEIKNCPINKQKMGRHRRKIFDALQELNAIDMKKYMKEKNMGRKKTRASKQQLLLFKKGFNDYQSALNSAKDEMETTEPSNKNVVRFLTTIVDFLPILIEV